MMSNGRYGWERLLRGDIVQGKKEKINKGGR